MRARRHPLVAPEQFGGPRHVCETFYVCVAQRTARELCYIHRTSPGARRSRRRRSLPRPAAPANPAAPNNAAAGVSPPQGDPQVLDQGPIHEAFAEPVALDAKPRVIVDREPPEPINELPPEVKPEGDNVEWIPGYWMWSDEQLNFVWVSGVWRDIPPGRRWVPGHWLQEGNSWVWVSGFWAGADWREVQMLPHPPATLEAGPSSPAPGDNFFWVPGCWIWSDGGYAWRAGYWYAGQPNWVWVPDHYCYTPAGSIFVTGYWDRPLWARGCCSRPCGGRRSGSDIPACLPPRTVVNSSLLLTSLFINTRHNNYWFGHGGWANHDFYRPWWDNRGGRRIRSDLGVPSLARRTSPRLGQSLARPVRPAASRLGQ